MNESNSNDNADKIIEHASVEIWVPGKPISKNMPTIVGWKPGAKFPPRMMVSGWPERRDAVRRHVKSELEVQGLRIGDFLFQNVWLDVLFTFALPLSAHVGKRKLEAGTPKHPYSPKPSKPDLDRHLNAIMDVLTGFVYEDDSSVTRITSAKRFLAQGNYEGEGTRIRLREDRADDKEDFA